MAGYAERMRQKAQKQAEKDLTSGAKGWVPPIGTHKIRILPPLPLKESIIFVIEFGRNGIHFYIIRDF